VTARRVLERVTLLSARDSGPRRGGSLRDAVQRQPCQLRGAEYSEPTGPERVQGRGAGDAVNPWLSHLFQSGSRLSAVSHRSEMMVGKWEPRAAWAAAWTWSVSSIPHPNDTLSRCGEVLGTQSDGRFSPSAAGFIPEAIQLQTQHNEYDALPGEVMSIRFSEILLPLGRPSGVWPAWNRLRGVISWLVRQPIRGKSAPPSRPLGMSRDPPTPTRCNMSKSPTGIPPADHCNSVYDRVEPGRSMRSNLGFQAAISSKCRPCVASRRTSHGSVCIQPSSMLLAFMVSFLDGRQYFLRTPRAKAPSWIGPIGR
jgi:hypothetical protein